MGVWEGLLREEMSKEMKYLRNCTSLLYLGIVLLYLGLSNKFNNFINFASFPRQLLQFDDNKSLNFHELTNQSNFTPGLTFTSSHIHYSVNCIWTQLYSFVFVERCLIILHNTVFDLKLHILITGIAEDGWPGYNPWSVYKQLNSNVNNKISCNI